jgi:hypothetical protein
MQQPRDGLGKHVPFANQLQLLDHNNRRTVLSTRSVQMGYKEDDWGDPVS